MAYDVAVSTDPGELSTYYQIARQEFQSVMKVDLAALFPDFGQPAPEKTVLLFRHDGEVVGGAELWVAELEDTSPVPIVNRFEDPARLVEGLPIAGSRFVTMMRLALAEAHRSFATVLDVLEQLGTLERKLCEARDVHFKLLVADRRHLDLYELAGEDILADFIVHETTHSIVADDYGGAEFFCKVIYPPPAA